MDNFKTSFAEANPLLLQQWHTANNPGLDPSAFGITSKQVVWWLCDKGHEWQQAIFSRRRSKNCPVCVNQMVQAGVNDLATVEPKLAKEWCYEKNTNVKLSEISAGSNKKFWWVCESGHIFDASPSKRVLERTGCPVCKNKVVVPGFNDLATTNPQIASTWHPNKNQGKSQHEVIAGTAKKYWWTCEMGHDYLMSGDKRIKGVGCPVCSNYSVVQGVNDLAHTHPELAQEWNRFRNKITASEVVGGSHKKIWWICANGHEWQATPVNRIHGTGCPSCSLGGFDPSARARIYFITNSKLESRKVGITNLTSERLDSFQKLGWTVIKIWEFEIGHDAKRVEKMFFEWLRAEVGLPPHLDGNTIGRIGGWTETFSISGPTDTEIIDKLNLVVLHKGPKK